MKKLHELEIADNTIVIFTSDNGPDGGSGRGVFNMFNKYNHMRLGMMRGNKASIYEGGHRVPLLIWWPLGTDLALQGTNFDLPVSQVDFFATFADILNYPLPGGEKCVYAYDYNKPIDSYKIGRPKRPTFGNTNSYFKYLTGQTPAEGYTSSVQLKNSKGLDLYLEEAKIAGLGRTELWKTKEVRTGFLLGWEGCMAEDSISFLSAFRAVKIGEEKRNGKTIHQFTNELRFTPSKLFSSKLGDLAIRFGRYKLIRFNAPKDLRTGLTNQHLVNNDGFTGLEGKDWLQASFHDRCSYDESGKLINQGCSVEPLCRNHTTFGVTRCMRDHYYQLWDLESNFGEKVECDDSSRHSPSNPNIDLETMIFDKYRSRGPEQPFVPKKDVGLGTESTPYGSILNDCCLLEITGGKKETVIPDPCSLRKIKNGGKITTGGKCVELEDVKVFGMKWNLMSYMYNWWSNYHLVTKGFGKSFGWKAETHFKWPKVEADWKGGYACDGIEQAIPDASDATAQRYIWDESMNNWRHSTLADRLCVPLTEKTLITYSNIKSECAINSHNGPLGEGWEANPQWKSDPKRSKNVYQGKLDHKDFNQWHQFASCLSMAMKLIEGQAYYPAIKRTTDDDAKITITYPELGAIKDDGTLGGKMSYPDSLARGIYYFCPSNENRMGNGKANTGRSQFVQKKIFEIDLTELD